MYIVGLQMTFFVLKKLAVKMR